MIIAIDPGGITGVAIYGPGHFQSYEVVGGFAGMSDWLVQHHDWWAVTDIVIESFVINAQTHRKSKDGIQDTLDIIGAVKHAARQRGITLHTQTPTEGKSFGTDTKLRRLGWHSPSRGGHKNDAARHLLTFLGAKRRDPDILEALTSA